MFIVQRGKDRRFRIYKKGQATPVAGPFAKIKTAADVARTMNDKED